MYFGPQNSILYRSTIRSNYMCCKCCQQAYLWRMTHSPVFCSQARSFNETINQIKSIFVYLMEKSTTIVRKVILFFRSIGLCRSEVACVCPDRIFKICIHWRSYMYTCLDSRSLNGLTGLNTVGQTTEPLNIIAFIFTDVPEIDSRLLHEFIRT